MRPARNDFNDFFIFSTIQILENVEIKADLEEGQRYFEGSVKFMKTLNQVLELLILNVRAILSCEKIN